MAKYFLSLVLCCSFLLANNTVAISYFDNTSNLKEYDAFSKGLADMLITDLSKVKSLQIVEREKLESLLKEINLGDEGFINASTAQKMGQGLGAKYILTGGFFIMDNVMRIDARLIEVETGVVIMAEEINGEKNAFFSLEKELANKLIDALAISISRSEQIALKRTSTKSFDAMLAYSDGLNQSDIGEYQAAVSSMEKALEIDDEFEKAAYRLDDILAIIESGIDIRTRAFPLQIVDLIDQLPNADKGTCEIFENTYKNFLLSFGIIDQLPGGVLMPDSTGIHQKYDMTARITYSDAWEQGYRYGIEEKPGSYDEFIFELGKKDYIAYGLFEYLLSKELDDSLCGVSNPNKKAYELLLGFIWKRYSTASPSVEHRIWPHMIDQEGNKIIDKWDYRKLYINLGSQYLERFPFGDQFSSIASNVRLVSEIEFENDDLWAIQKWLYKHDRYNTHADGEQDIIFYSDILNLSGAEFSYYYDMGPDSYGRGSRSLNSIPKEIGVLKNLKILDLSNNRVKDIPVEISKLKNSLEFIDLRDNGVEWKGEFNHSFDLERLESLLPNTIILSGKINPYEKAWKRENPKISTSLSLKDTSTEDLWFLTIAICADILNHTNESDELNLESISIIISIEDLYLQTFAAWNDSFPVSNYGYFKQFINGKGSTKIKELSDAFDYLYRNYDDSFYSLPTYKKIKKLNDKNELKEKIEAEKEAREKAELEQKIKEEENKLKQTQEMLKNGQFPKFSVKGEKYIFVGVGDYIDKLQQGLWTYYYPNGKVRAKGSYIDGNGEIQKTIRRNGYTNEILDDNDPGEGYVITKRGNPIPKDGRDGEWMFYYEDGIIEEISNYSNGVLDGPFIFYYYDGEVREKGDYINGALLEEDVIEELDQ